MSEHIQYSMCWEDPDIVCKALNITKNDKVLSIASGGENVFAILLKNPLSIVAIDNNKYQIYLLRLKIAAIKSLEFLEFVSFLGLINSDKRFKYFERCKKYLSNEEIEFWFKNPKYIKKGVVHIGKFESYLGTFRRFILPLVLSKKQINHYLSLKSIRGQELFFRNEWDNWRWKLLFKVFFSRTVMQLLGRKREYFKYNQNQDIAAHYYFKSKYGFTKTPIKDNFFVNYILIGTIPTPFKNHPYLDKSNFYKLKKLLYKIKIVNQDLSQFLDKLENNEFSKYNLSNLFELMSQKEYEQTLKKIKKTSKKGTILCYWNNLVPRFIHPDVKDITPNNPLSKKLLLRDRVFFYSKFIVETVK